MLTPDQARRAIRREWARMLDALEASPTDTWERPTRCAGWAVRDLARHTAWGTSMEAEALARAGRGDPTTAVGVDPAPYAEPAALLDALRGGVAALGSELDAAEVLVGSDARVPLPFGPVPAGFALDVFTMEAGTHADDLAVALGVDAPLGADVVAATMAVLGAVMPVLATLANAPVPAVGTVVALVGPTVDLAFTAGEDAWTLGGVEPSVRVEGVDDTAAVRFALGRIAPGHPSLAVTGDGDAVKRWFPGP